MTIDKAVELLKELPLPLNTASDHDNHLAVRLGIEALDRVLIVRDDPDASIDDLLEGETKD